MNGRSESQKTLRPDDRLGAEWLCRALALPDGQEPFPWQFELLRRFRNGDVVKALDIPTGLGKTATMAIWLVARACGAALPSRLVYVVDRRVVVDQATDVAEGLRAWVLSEPEVGRALGLEGALRISTLRGQHADNREWLEDPSAPAIVIGTVDMIGSRLLFSGYGISAKMRSYHAGLLGADTLVVLDEAHLVPPFERLVEQIANGVDANGRSLVAASAVEQSVVPRLRFMSLSATGRERAHHEVLRLSEQDRLHDIVTKRLLAKKRLIRRATVDDKELPDALADEAWALSNGGCSSARIIVFCTRRDQAQKIQEAIRRRAKDRRTIDTELFVGARRVYERDLVSKWLGERGFLAGSVAKPDCATFLIATAAGEVGVDLDADHAVCDLVAWERMVQRFGRVNRRGDGDATIIVVPASTDDEKAKVRREAVVALLDVLPQAEGEIDVSLEALTKLKERSELRALIERASTPTPLHPPLTRALVEAWSMTSLEEHSGRPEVAPWIRGWPDEREDAQTTIAWRRCLPVTDGGRLFGRQELEAFREAADPHLAERLETETWRVIEWLSKRLKLLGVGNAQEAETDRFDRSLRVTDVVAVIFDSPTGVDRVVMGDALSDREKRDDLERALRGATVIVDRRVGGLTGGLLDQDNDEPVIDITEDSGTNTQVVPFRIRRVIEGESIASEEAWRTEVSIPVRWTQDGESAWLLVESLAGHLAGSEEGRSGAKRAQYLDEHQEWAEVEARRLASQLHLSSDMMEVLAVSARLHDEGKRAKRWQRAFRAPDDGIPPYAKTQGRPNLLLLEGYRHELGSLPYAEAHARVKALAPLPRDLCLHMIAAHHGSARPLIRTSGATEPPTRLRARSRAVMLRFVALQQAWGPWGLAWCEALLRAADQQASRRNDRQGDSRG